MFRSAMLVMILLGGGLFAFYFLTDARGKSGGERAADALSRVGDAAMDQGIAGAAKGRLAVCYGIDGVRFLHTWFDEGRLLVYGMAPPQVTPDQIAAEVRVLPGVREVEVQVTPRPGYLSGTSATATHATDIPAPKPADGGR
ncbi:MAG: hypothetical protein HRU75_13190 [Planctomycetia bacterium]|nr:MAG: hypothetical protein HRU75_13190 [Planctomycetia bacterium]